ncbi:MAG: hypothetical protein ACYDBB_04980 [Armatimonadota bacterium]
MYDNLTSGVSRQYHVINPDGSKHPAASVQVLAQWAQQGNIGANTILYDATTNQSFRASDIPELRGYFQPTVKHPKCMVCGYIGPFNKPPFIYTHDLIISIVLFCLFGAGLIWFTISVLIKKPMSCPHCNSKGLFTFDY